MAAFAAFIFAPVPSFADTYRTAAVTVGNTSGLALANGVRMYLALLNEDSAKTIACNLGGTAAINTAGSITLAPNGGGFVFDSQNGIPSDAINCIASSASGALTIIYVSKP